MENRRPIYYTGNTVRPPKIKQKCKDQVKNAGVGFFEHDEKGKLLKNPNKFMVKVCATSKCLWCDTEFDSYKTICPNCRNCQFCGFYSESVNDCIKCGNHAPDELRIEHKRIVIF